ncbi:uncharacterized protein LOC120291123 [Eucalyptus grandis]|uniref:uncharacterized protein LOC120291123 n=1 Tax=Eucalyptus grandis TaxID=71139 RepID=UPI00192E765D|nr:uncharacterized protein LOC120291123 [Eucalyptus grandis]
MADALISNQTFLLMPAPEGSFCVGTQIWRPFDLNKVRTPPPASEPTPTFAFLMSTLTSPPPPPMSAFALHTAVRMSGTTSPAYVSALAPPMAASTSSESTSSASASSGSALALPMSRMKISTSAHLGDVLFSMFYCLKHVYIYRSSCLNSSPMNLGRVCYRFCFRE